MFGRSNCRHDGKDTIEKRESLVEEKREDKKWARIVFSLGTQNLIPPN